MKSVSGASSWTFSVITSIFRIFLLEPLTAFSTKLLFLTFNSCISHESKGWGHLSRPSPDSVFPHKIQIFRVLFSPERRHRRIFSPRVASGWQIDPGIRWQFDSFILLPFPMQISSETAQRGPPPPRSPWMLTDLLNPDLWLKLSRLFLMKIFIFCEPRWQISPDDFENLLTDHTAQKVLGGSKYWIMNPFISVGKIELRIGAACKMRVKTCV